MSIRKDYTADVLRLLEGLRREIEDKKCIAGFMFPVKKEDLVFNIEKIKASIPREMKDAAMTNRESERILEDAEDEAGSLLERATEKANEIVRLAQQKSETMIAQAQLQQTQMVEESEVLRIAKAQADEIRSTTDRESREMRRGADQYALDVMNNLENVVGRVLHAVEKGRRELDDADVRAVVEPGRERIEAK